MEVESGRRAGQRWLELLRTQKPTLPHDHCTQPPVAASGAARTIIMDSRTGRSLSRAPAPMAATGERSDQTASSVGQAAESLRSSIFPVIA